MHRALSFEKVGGGISLLARCISGNFCLLQTLDESSIENRRQENLDMIEAKPLY